MNKIFKTKYDVTTGQTKVVSELANNRQVASRVEGASGRQPKCGVFLGMFKILPLALLMSELLSSVAYGVNVWIDVNPNREPGGDNKPSSVWYEKSNVNNTEEVVLLADGANKTGANTRLTNKDFKKTVVIGSRAVGGGNDATAIGYRAIVGKNLDSTNTTDSHQGTAVGYRAFSYGNESVSLGNDTVARGSNSIAIGSDNISGENAKPLPKEIFTIFLDNAANFNYTGEYAAVDYNKLFEGTDVIEKNTNKNKYVNGDGNLVSDDGFTIGWNGRYYIRKTKSNHKDYYVLIGDQYYEKSSNGNLNPIEKPKNIEQMDDYKRMEKYNGYLEKAYEKYLADTDRNKKTHTWARGNNSIAIGGRSVAYGNYSTALGTYAIAYKDYSAAIGTNTIAFGRNSLVFGNDSYVYADRSVGVGTNVQAVNAGSMVYGSDSYSGGSGSLAMGNYALANIAMDENFTGKGLKSSKLLFTDNANKDEYKDDKYFFDKFYELGNTKDIQNNRTSIKPKTTKQRGTGEEKAEQSKDNQGKHNQGAIAIGSYTVALGDNALSIGRYAYAKEDSTVAIGRFAFAKEANAFALGSFTRALEKSSIALGNEATATLENSVALGYKSKTDYEHSKSDPYTPEGAIIIPTSTNVGVISVGYNGYERRMVNVAAGSQDTDAVNVAQLKALETRIDLNNKQNNLTPYFGVEQKSGDSAKIAQGQEAKQNYERYVKLSGEYAKLLNRKVNGKETFKQEALDKVKKELDALEKSNPQIATNASTIKKIVEDLGKEKGGDGNKLLTKLKEITQAVETDMAKKDQVANLSEQEIEESNYKGSLAKGKDSIAIGYKASVAEVAEDSVAIGKGSKVTAKQEAKNKAEINGVEFTFKGGVSPDNKEESKKTIFSVGDTNQERIIKNVAAGDVSENSTDAINGSQLYAVTKVFSDLAKDVIGVEVDNKQFKKSSFTAVEYISTPTSKKGVPDNFKDALDETIKAINQGYKFSDGTTNNNGTSKYYLGSTLEIKNGDVDGFKGSNLKVKLDTQASNEKATFTIGMTNTPTFENVTITGNPSNDKHLVNKKYVDDKFKNVATSFKVTGDSGEYVVKDALNIKGKEENSHKNITTTANNGTKKELEISLNSTLKGITSIGKDENNQITFNGGTKIKAGGAVLSLSKTSDDKVKISGVADGVAENDVVNFKQLEASKLHFLSVKAPTTPESKNNYNNDGATADGAIAIGVGTKATAENAVVIGRDVSIDVKNSFVLGSNNTVTQTDKDVRSAVVVIGSGTKLENSKSSIAIGAVFVKGKNGADGTLIENAAWTASIGNKNKIKNGTDIVALGNNIKALDSTNEETKGTKSANTELVLIGNSATAETAQNSVLIGAKSNAGKGAKNAVIIGHSAKAEASAVGAVAIGQGATVKTDAGNSIALGQGSEATKKEKSEATYTTDTNSIKFINFSGHGNDKSVLSIGDTGKERLITHVAPGTISASSTHAINGSQLYSVIDVFGHLGVTVLGAEVDTTKGFKQSEFKQLIGKTITASTPATAKTFKKAIDDNIAKINEGFIFGAGDSDEEKGTHYLGDSLIIKAGTITVEDKQTKKTDKFLSDNIRTHYEKGNKNILIGIKENPNFKEVTVSEEVKDTSKDNVLTTKKYVTDKLDGKADKFNTGDLVSNGLIEVEGGDKAVIGSGVSIDLNKETKDKIALIGTGKVEKDDKGTVTGKTVYEYMQGFSTSLILSKDGSTADATINLKTDKLQVEGQDGINVEIKDKKITVKIDGESKGKIDDILTKTEAGTTYAKVDASNISNGDITKWRSKLDVYSKGETDGKINTEISKTTFGLKGNDSSDFTKKVNNVIEIKGTETTTNQAKNIYVSKDGEGLKIELGETLTGITSIGKDTNDGITFSENTTTIKLGGVSLSLNKTLDKVKISNVANGIDDNDAINKSQLDKFVTALGGGSKIGTDGTPTGPTYTLTNGSGTKSYTTVGDALKALDGAITTTNSSITTLNDASIKFSDGSTNPSKVFERKNSDTDKQVIIKGENNINVALSIDDTKNKGTFTVSLNKQLKGIESIENDDKTKITLNKGDKSIKFSSGDTPSVVTLTGSKLSGLTEINKQDGKASLKFEDNKIELITENDKKVTLEKDSTNDGVQATGLTTIGKDTDNALVFDKKENGTDKATLKVGGNSLTFTKDNSSIKLSGLADGKIDGSSTEAITGKQLHELSVSRLGLEVDNTDSKNIKFKDLSFDAIKGSDKSDKITTFKGAIEGLIGAVNKGITFKGTDSSKTTTLQLGATLTINGEDTKVGKESNKDKTEKDIKVEVTPNDTDPKDPKNAGTITLKLNKSNSVDENDDRAIKSSAVANELKKYTTTETLGKEFLKVTGENIGKNQATFGENVGIAEIALEKEETEGTSELVQAKALVDYLKGTGEKSVKLSDSAKTQAIGEGSISIGHNAVSRNEGSIAMGYNSEASNSGAISIGQGSTVLGTSSVAVGKENDVKGNFSFVLGDENKIGLNSTSSYVIGSNNEIKGYKNISIGLGNKVDGNENILLGSHIETDDTIKNAIVLGDRSIGVSNAVSVGNAVNRRKIVFVADPTDKYDAVNKKYVDELKLTYKSNSTNKQTVKLTDGLDFKKATNDNIEVVVDKNGSIQHNLANNLKDITSIWGGTDEKGAKITLDKAKKEISFNDSKLTNLADGEIDKDSKEAVTGKQLADLASKLGVAVDKDKTKFNELIFEYLSNVDGSFKEKNPTTLKEAIDETRAKLNEGLKFGGDVTTGKNNGTHYLGSSINIVRLGTPTGTGAVDPTSTDGYSGSNLITQYTYDKGNAKIEIGFKDAPTFNKVTLSAPQTYGNKGVEDNDLITKSYLEQALDSFKFNVANSDGTTYQIGRNDTLKFNAGLNIKVELAQNGTTQPSAGSSALASGAGTAGGGNGTATVGTSGSSGVAAQGAGATVGSSTTPTTAPTNTVSNSSAGADSTFASSTTSSNGAGTNGKSGTSSTASSGATPSTTTAGTASSTP
ncbi:hypothetical protein E5361_09635, partial [Histophilus somni]